MATSITELLNRLRKLDVQLWSEGDRLRCSAKSGVLTPSLQAEIARRKPELLDFLSRTQRNRQSVSLPLRRIPRNGTLPTSFGQQRLWFLQELDPDSYAYNIPGAVRIYGPLDASALDRTLQTMVQRHETLRTSFELVEGSLVQVIGHAVPVRLELIDLTGRSKTEQEEQTREWIRREARRPFVLSTGPHWRVSLRRLGREEHILIVIQHHIISDGWSLGIFVREMGELYDAFIADVPSPLKPLSIQYADYAVWQRQWLSGEAVEELLAFWKRHLQGPLPTLDLFTDRPRPQLQTFNGSLVGTLLPAPLNDSLKAFSQKEGATLFMTLLAAFNALLCRYSDQKDLIVGTSIGNRNHVETESLIGFFVNTLALRTDLSGDPPFREVLARVRRVALDAYDHQDLPFERLVEELQPVRDLSRSPVFQVMFTLHNTPTEQLELQNLTLSGVECDIGTAKFDLTLSVSDLGRGLAAVMEYNTDLFEAATIRRMLAHWQVLLEHAIAKPETRISELPLLTAVEQKRVIRQWNATEASYPDDATLCDLFARQVQHSADRIAVEFSETNLTYRELDDRSTRLAQGLTAAGARRGSLVGICVERSPQLVVGLLAILKTGAAYLPLDAELPAKRLEYMLADSNAPLVLADRHSASRLPPVPARLVPLEETVAENSGSPIEPVRLCPEDTAYLMYTSGSTGRPKAVTVPHRSVVNFLESIRRRPGLERDDVLLAVTPITFDISVLELLLPLITGARVAIADRQTSQDPDRLSRRLAETRASVMQATPAMWKMLVDAGWPGMASLKALCGGETLPRDLADQLLDRCGSLWNMYGPTETTVWSAVQRLTTGESLVPIGRPIQNTQVYLLDAHLQPVPVGVSGELYIGGDGLADGYFRRPSLTAQRFVPDPFAGEPGRRLYRTGDLARYLPSGRIEFLGRLDHQVKIRGFRIELGEIEAALRGDPDIRDAVIMMLENGDSDRRLLAYVVPHEGGSIRVSEVRARLGEQLPPSMQPSEFVVMDELPLTPSGKVDRRSLPAPDYQRPELNAPYTAPRNETEQAIQDVWKQLLPVDQIGICDNFFDLGGHSLLLVQMQRRINEVLHASVSVVDLFRFPTIAAIATFVRGDACRSDSVREAGERAAARKRVYERQRRQASDETT